MSRFRPCAVRELKPDTEVSKQTVLKNHRQLLLTVSIATGVKH